MVIHIVCKNLLLKYMYEQDFIFWCNSVSLLSRLNCILEHIKVVWLWSRNRNLRENKGNFWETIWRLARHNMKIDFWWQMNKTLGFVVKYKRLEYKFKLWNSKNNTWIYSNCRDFSKMCILEKFTVYKLALSFSYVVIHSFPSWLIFLAEINCTVHTALPKWPKTSLICVQQSRQHALRAYFSNMLLYILLTNCFMTKGLSSLVHLQFFDMQKDKGQ